MERNSRLDDVVDRHAMLARAVWGDVGVAAAATAGSVVLASPAEAQLTRLRHRTAVYDVACLLNTFTAIVADGSTAPDTNFRGTTFFVEGELYPGGTIPADVRLLVLSTDVLGQQAALGG